MRNYIAGSVVLAALLVGCGGNSGNCCDGSGGVALDSLGNAVVYSDPVAVLDYNYTIATASSASDGETNIGGTTQDIPASSVGSRSINFIFNCNSSYDLDENNMSISRCDWNVTKKPEGCNDNNVTVGNEFALICDDNIGTVDELIIKLTVTDDENVTDSNSTTITF